jgi:hypothetical protein
LVHIYDKEVTLQGTTYDVVYGVLNRATNIVELYHPSIVVCKDMSERWHSDLNRETHLWHRVEPGMAEEEVNILDFEGNEDDEPPLNS